MALTSVSVLRVSALHAGFGEFVFYDGVVPSASQQRHYSEYYHAIDPHLALARAARPRARADVAAERRTGRQGHTRRSSYAELASRSGDPDGEAVTFWGPGAADRYNVDPTTSPSPSSQLCSEAGMACNAASRLMRSTARRRAAGGKAVCRARVQRRCRSWPARRSGGLQSARWRLRGGRRCGRMAGAAACAPRRAGAGWPRHQRPSGPYTQDAGRCRDRVPSVTSPARVGSRLNSRVTETGP